MSSGDAGVREKRDSEKQARKEKNSKEEDSPEKIVWEKEQLGRST